MEERQLQRCTIKRRRRGNLNLNLGGDGVLFEFLSDLPESLLLEIFLRLPLKSIFRSKCVSKSWLSLISDPMFAQSYFRRSQIMDSRRVNTYPPWALLYRYGCHLDLSPDDRWLHVFNRATHPVFGRLPNFTLRFLSEAGATRDDGKAPVVVLAVSNGLLLSTSTPGWHDCYYVCNPLTRQWSALPKPPRIHKWVSLGFIVEPINGTFQVVRIGGYKGSSNTVNFEIFSSKTRQWKDKMVSFDLLVRVFYCPQMVNYRHAVPCKKILHWIEYNDRIIMYDTSQTDTAIDETIRCRLIDLPGDQAIHDKAITGILGVCQDHLRYCRVAEGSQNFGVWELRKYNNERVWDWVILFKIRFDDINPSLSEVPGVVAFHPFDPDRLYLYRFPDKLASLNLRTRVCRDRIRLKGVLNWWTVFAFVLPPWPTPVPQISSTPVGLL